MAKGNAETGDPAGAALGCEQPHAEHFGDHEAYIFNEEPLRPPYSKRLGNRLSAPTQGLLAIREPEMDAGVPGPPFLTENGTRTGEPTFLTTRQITAWKRSSNASMKTFAPAPTARWTASWSSSFVNTGIPSSAQALSLNHLTSAGPRKPEATGCSEAAPPPALV